MHAIWLILKMDKVGIIQNEVRDRWKPTLGNQTNESTSEKRILQHVQETNIQDIEHVLSRCKS